MRILLDSYNTALQSGAGGVQTKVLNHLKDLNDYQIYAKLFSKWEDKLSDYDIIHFFKLQKEYYDLILYAKKIGIKVVLSSIVPQEHTKKFFIGRALDHVLPITTTYSLTLSILKNCDCIIAETSLEKDCLVSYYGVPESLVTVIPNAIEDYSLDSDVQLYKRSRHINNEFILVVGRFNPNKNQLSIIRALKDSEIPVVFIGGPSAGSEDYYQQCIAEASQSMIFEGWMDRSDPLYRSAYSSAKVVALASFREIFGNAVLEGAMAGANVVTTNAIPVYEWGLRGLVEEIEPTDVSSIKKGLLKAYSAPRNPLLRQVSKTQFSRDVLMTKYVDIYKRLIDEDSKGSL